MDAYRNFVPDYPRFSLTTLPSPLDRALRLEQALRDDGAGAVPRLYLKRDDMLSLALGGNKIRNLEFIMGDAIEAGATDIVTAGRVQSNHCRLTAAACVRAGLRAHLVLSGSEPADATGNLLLDRLLGANIYFTGSDDRAVREAMVREIVSGIERRGGRPYEVPVGGSDPRGALGHALAALELTQQLDALDERPTAIVLATATGGTQAGLLMGFRKLRIDVRVQGFAVAKSADELRVEVRRLCDALAGELGVTPVADDDIRIDGTMLGAGYGVPSAAGSAASELLARTEGVLADPVYTAKAFAGLMALLRAETFADADVVVFIHTGGAPALFADLPATSL